MANNQQTAVKKAKKKAGKKNTPPKQAAKAAKSSRHAGRNKPPGKKAKKKSGKKRTRAKSPEPKPHAGRRTLLTPKLQQDLVTIITAGNYNVTACNYCGVAESTFYSWLKRGEEELHRLVEAEKDTGKPQEPLDGELLYLEFLEAIKKAEAGAEVSAVLKVKSAFGGNWQAAMTFLERRFSDRWRRKERHELTDGEGNAIQAVIYLPDNNRDEVSND